LQNIVGRGGGPDYQQDRRAKHRLPEDLDSYAARSWVSPGGATLRREVQPVSPEQERLIISGLIHDLNALYGLNLGKNTDLRRRQEEEEPTRKKALVIGGSHAANIANELEHGGFETLRICKSGFRAIKPNVTSLLPKVSEELKKLGPDDVIILQMLDNVSYMGRTEEGGDLPIRRIPNGEYHIDGDLILAGYDRQKMIFDTIEPLLQVLDDRQVILLSPMPRWLYGGCCNAEDHAPNRRSATFEQTLRSELKSYRISLKNLCFARNHRRVKVLDPSPALPFMDEEGDELWGRDPVHPLRKGYKRVADLLVKEMTAGGRGVKRPAETNSGQNKRPRLDRRPAWIEGANETAERRDTTYRGGGGRGGPRGGAGRGHLRGGYRGRGGRGGPGKTPLNTWY